MNKFLKIIISSAVIGATLFVFQDPLENIFSQIKSRLLPCQQPIAYSIGSFDSRFDISKENFLQSVSNAEKIWEEPIDKQLFKYNPNGNLKINLIYDIRQEATSKLQKLGITVDASRASFDALKAKYDTLKGSYLVDKATLEYRVSTFEERKKKYEAEVNYWNKRGGANQEKYQELEAEREWLNEEVEKINNIQNALNLQVDEINAMAVVLNSLAASLNIKVDQFNQIGGTLGGEFTEGTFESGPEGQKIDIYQFESRNKLIRILAHEFGHALGLGHIEDPKAIMYRLNNGINEKLTADDLAELKKRCGIK